MTAGGGAGAARGRGGGNNARITGKNFEPRRIKGKPYSLFQVCAAGPILRSARAARAKEKEKKKRKKTRRLST